MQLTHVLLLAGALGVTAHPSGHAHNHRAAHEKRDVPTFVKNVHKPVAAPAPSAAPSAAAAPAPAAAAPAPASSAAAPKSSAESSSAYVPFCSETGGKKVKRATLDQIMYTGNIGMTNNCPWASNIMVVPNNIAHLYKYVQTYTNVASEKYQVLCGNKMGAEPGQLTGMFSKVPNQELVTFDLAPGETKTVVMEGNTQGICAFAPGTVPTTTYGQYAGVWVEVDFENSSNAGWSGADCSSLVAQAYDMDVPGCSVCGSGVCSKISPGGHADNAYTKGMEALDGIGLNLPAGDVVLEVKVGYS
ncbi:hypothetical protein B0H67DRAFT_476067 [Lasiosphaeris hirsuta]|uniref:Allergen Asp f 4 n=1 Tax=Lasiosphaeris hirsuta TaxID=260670 RepID=A0AA40BAW9_9PEZI|nr:hypothetical protein B0H67DRAFT_476067 [Lasiosphaeris hirsuta]